MFRAVAALVLAGSASAVPTTINNLVPRLDNTGAIMDSHDFSLRLYPDGYYYMTSVAYGGCTEPANLGCDQTSDHCGFQMNHTVNVWRSQTLASGSWEFVAEAVAPADRPAGTVYRPDAIWNPNTNETVLWFNFVFENGTYAGYAAYTAPGPAGPFALQRTITNVSTNNATWHCGDFHLFVDDDNTPYIIMGCNFHMIIERLMPNMLDSTGENVFFGEYFIEAPMLFKRGPTYYALFDHCCCYCYQGSGVLVHTAPAPLGPWTTQAGPDVACIPTPNGTAPAPARGAVEKSPVRHEYSLAGALGLPPGAEPTPGQGCQYANPATTSALHSQQSFIAQVETTQGVQFLWAGDRWQQSWDGTKGHDPQFWRPIPFFPNGSIGTMGWIDNFTFELTSTLAQEGKEQ